MGARRGGARHKRFRGSRVVVTQNLPRGPPKRRIDPTPMRYQGPPKPEPSRASQTPWRDNATVRAIRRMKLKLVVVGDRAVGKTSLMNRYVFDSFSDVYHGTLGSRLSLLSFSQVVSGEELVEAEVAMFDLMGERSVPDAFKDVMFWGTHGFLVVADVTRRETISSVPGWVETVQSVAGGGAHHGLLNKGGLAGGKNSPGDTAYLPSPLPGGAGHLTEWKDPGGGQGG